MNIGIIDADLLDKGTTFPNLALMKISSYYKSIGDEVNLVTDYNQVDEYERIFLSKVFDFTKIPIDLIRHPQIEYDGTGFYYDKASNLFREIEHIKPDYQLYNDYIKDQIFKGVGVNKFDNYLKYSIGFTTRGCFRKCKFCVNKKYSKVIKHSPLSEFIDQNRKYICLLDDNILAFKDWQPIIEELISLNKPFQFKQGMDIRLMTVKKSKILSGAKYRGDYIFAFDNYNKKDSIIRGLLKWRNYNHKNTKMYVLSGFDYNDRYDNEFWTQDIVSIFKRIEILNKFNCLPYIMRHKNYLNSPYKGMYINLARWCNQPSFFKKLSFREFCEKHKENSSTMRYMQGFEKDNYEVSKQFFDMKYEWQ